MSNFKEKVCINAFDEKTAARLERERKQTAIGLSKLRNRGIIGKEVLDLSRREQSENEKLENEEEKAKVENSKEIEIPKWNDKSYKFTKWSKLKIRRLKNEKLRREACLNQYKRWKFFCSLNLLKNNLLNLEWNRTCHSKERAIIRENLRLDNIMRIRWKYEIDEIIPPNSVIFDKILKYKRERRRQIKLRKERMMKIIQKIAQEMKPKKQVSKKIMLERIRKESSAEISMEEYLGEGEDVQSLSKIVEEDFAITSKKDEDLLTGKEHFTEVEKIEGSKQKPDEIVKDDNVIETKEIVSSNDNHVFGEAITTRGSESSTTEIFPSDTCFFANPSVVVFDDFEVGENYSQKLTITNKIAKWAYLRFNKVHSEIWEPVIEIGTMDAARVKPGLHVIANVKFSPVHDEKVTAEISFLTLNADNPNTFHEFRVPVLCNPANPVPVLDPREVRFPTGPMWKFKDSKFSERVLTISNEGRKSFSIKIGERNDLKDCFFWYFDDADAQSAKSLNSSIDENENGENHTDNNTEDSDTPRKMLQIEVPPKVKCQLRISFHPRHIGLHHEVIKIYFYKDEQILDKQEVPVWARVIESQIYLDPPCVDLGVAMIDSDVCQQSFNVVNAGRCSVQVSIRSPKRLGNQVTVHPRSTIVQPETFFMVNVRLVPESNILHMSKRFYDLTTSMLKFPIHVYTVSQDAENPPPIVLNVLASLTTCRGLVLEPAYIDLGRVFTHESVYTELKLTNDSLLIQEYGFLNLPPFMEVQPNHGFGTILPMETVELHLIYSGCLHDIPGNEIGSNGLTGERRFQVRVVTLAELAGNNKEMRNLRNLCDARSTIQRRGLPPATKTPEVTVPSDLDENDVEDSKDDVDSNSSAFEDDSDTEEVEDVPIRRRHSKDKRKEKNIINILVYIVDTFCEFSEQILVFPATPCGSFSIASLHLRGFNMASYPHCTCGIVKNQEKEFTARFEFKCSSAHVQVAPQSGRLHSKQLVKANFIFTPRLLKTEETRETKMNTEEREQREKSEKDNKSHGKGKARKGRKAKIADEKEEISDVEKLPDEIILLETFEPRVSTIFVTCRIDLETKDGAKRNELLFAKLICPITRPDIVILNENREVAFGPTAIGASSRKFLLVKNISNKTVKVNVSLLDPFGPFFVPPGKTIETGSILNLPITYQPSQNQLEEESFEVSSHRTRTNWRVKVTGSGVVPSYIIRPRFRVARLEVIDDKPLEFRITIQNTGICPLTFRLRLIDTLQGNIPRTTEESPEKSPTKSSKSKTRRKIDVESERKTPRKPVFGDVLRRDEELAIFGGKLERSADRCFSFWNLDENMQLLVPERKKVKFGIRFQRPSVDGHSEIEKVVEGTTKRKKKKGKESSKKDEVVKSNYYHVAVLELTLGSSTFVQDLVIICSL